MRKVTPYVGEAASARNGDVGELASFLARMEGAAEVSADHVASAARITTGTTLEEGFDAASDDETNQAAVAERPATPTRRSRGRPSASRAAITILLAVAGCLVASNTRDNLVSSVVPPREKVASVIVPLPPRRSVQEPLADPTPSVAPRPARDGVPASARDGPDPARVAKSDPVQAVEPPAVADQPVKSASITPQSPALSPLQPTPPLPMQTYAAPTPLPRPIPAEGATPVPLSPNVVVFIRRADRLIELGDISGARLLYERAASLGSGAAAFSMGRTFDPAFLSALHASIPPDEVKSAEWYRRAVALGSTEAAASLRLLDHLISR